MHAGRTHVVLYKIKKYSMTSDLNLKKEFYEKGYAVIPLLDKYKVSSLRNKILAQFEPGRSGELYMDFYLKEMGDYPFFFQEKLTATIKAIFPSVIHIPDLNIQVNRIDQFSPQKGWHVDCNFEDRQNLPYLAEPDYHFLKVGIYLQDDTQEFGGGIDVQTGSHRLFEGINKNWIKKIWKKFRMSIAQYYPYIRLPIKAGDAVLFDSRLIHRSSACEIPTNKIAKENTQVVMYWDVAGDQAIAEKFYYSLITRVFNPGLPEAAKIFWGNMLAVDFPDDFGALQIEQAEKDGVSFWSHSPKLSAYFKDSIAAHDAESGFLTSSFPSHPARIGHFKTGY